MDLYLIRHGECGDSNLSPEGPPLTPEGAEHCQRVSAHILELGRRAEALYCSPLLRAVESAAPFARVWGLSPQVVPWLSPSTAISTVLERVRAIPIASLALVGHLPNLGLLLGAMLWGLPPKEIVIPRGGVVLLDCKHWDPGTAKLKWMLSPEAFSATPGHQR